MQEGSAEREGEGERGREREREGERGRERRKTESDIREEPPGVVEEGGGQELHALAPVALQPQKELVHILVEEGYKYLAM